jgi:hypothetical protein
MTNLFLNENWTEPEKWVWEKTCLGEVANFNDKFSKVLNPKDAEGGDDQRLISYAFLESVLLQDPYRKAVPRQGLRIAGAWFREKIDLSNARLGSVIWLDRSRFDETVNLSFIRTDDFISLENSFFAEDLDLHSLESKQSLNLGGSRIEGNLIMYFLSVEKSMFLRNGLECTAINMRNARIGGQLDMSGARFIQKPKPENDSTAVPDENSFTEFDFSNADIGGSLIMNGIEVSGKLDFSGLVVHRDVFIKEEVTLNEVEMTGAEIGGQLSLSDVKISGLLELNGTSIHADLFIRDHVFCKDISLVGAKIGGQLDIRDTTVEGLLDLDSVVVASDVFMKKGIEIGELNMIGGTIGGELSISNAKIESELDMSGLTVALDLTLYRVSIGERRSPIDEPQADTGMPHEAEKRTVVGMRSMKIGGQLDLVDIQMKDKLIMDGISVARKLFIRENSKFHEIQMVGANVGGHLVLSKINVDHKLEIQSITVGQSIFIRECVINERTSLIDSTVNGSVVMSRNRFSHLDLGGTSVLNELQIGESGEVNVWVKRSAINLRNARVGTLSDGGVDAWPEKIDLDGFIYTGLGRGARGDATGHDLDTQEVHILKHWLGRQKPYSSQPYYQLAQLLSKLGHSEKANSILYASRERERDAAWHTGLKWKWLGLSILNWTIGYGYGARYFRSLIWVVILLLIGIVIIGTVETGTMESASLLDKFGFSLDKLIPVIELNDKYKLDFSGWQLLYFYFHRIMGVILSSFVVAGLSGITKE